jgi:antagonist of KipI
MAIDGGIDVPTVMNSRSAYGPAGADYQLKDKDIMRTLPPSPWGLKIKEMLKCKKVHAARWWPVDAGMNYYSDVIRVTRGPEWDRFDASSQEAFFHDAFAISRNSDRMGYRLEVQGPLSATLLLKDHSEMISTAVTKGTIQVMHEGSPMVLMSDAQTTGGYPRIAQVIAADLPLLAQKKPGEAFVFEQVSAEKAEELYLRQIKDLLRLEKNLKAKFLT